MGPVPDVATRFDRVAPIYDETREQLTEGAVEKLAAVLHRDDVKSVLEAGVGTGRFALPLQEKHFEVTGLDLSIRMLTRAKAKGVARLVTAEADAPPFRKKGFDAVIMAHVLHLLDDPARTFRSLSETAKKEIDVFVRRAEASRGTAGGAREEFYRAFGAAAKEIGVSLGERYREWPERYAKQNSFLARNPPDERVTIQERDRTQSMRGYMPMMEPLSWSFAGDVSQVDFAKVVEHMTATVDLDRAIPYHRVDQMLIWHL